jgi:plasmid stability protein
MPAVTVRNLSEETHRAIKQRATAHGISTEAEIRSILDDAVQSKDRVRFGTALYEMSRDFGGVDLDIERDRRPSEAAEFE